MYFENEKPFARQRSNDEFLRRMRSDEFFGFSDKQDLPTLARTDIPGKNERPRVSCDGTPQAQSSTSPCPNMPSLAMVYSPVQAFENLLSPQEGLAQGTIFLDLIKPFETGERGTRGCQTEGGCRK